MIYILLPAYNEELSLKPQLEKIVETFKSIKEPYQIIICDDGSTDKTKSILKEYKKKLPLTVIEHKINRGLGETVRDLFEKASELSDKNDVIIRMDCDDTHEASYIPELLKKISEGNDVVIASRYREGASQMGVNAYRTSLSYLACLFMKLFFPIKGVRDYTCGYRAYKADIIKEAIAYWKNSFIQLKNIGFVSTLEKIVKLDVLGGKFTEIPFVLRYDQKASQSKMRASTTIVGYFWMLILNYWPFGGWRVHKKRIRKVKLKNIKN